MLSHALHLRDQQGLSLRDIAAPLVSTLTVLERAAGERHIPDKATMRGIHDRLRGLDDGLPPIENTNLLASVHRS